MVVDGNRLGIPALFGFDVVHGLRTIFPVPIGMAASWDPVAIEAAQRIAAREARAVGIHWAFAPMIDIARDPRWGRMVEGAGEDPHLAGVVAAAQVRGFQQADDPAETLIAGPKHLVGYGAAAGGRDYDEVELSDSDLWNVYLPPFKAAVDAGAKNIMTAYMTLNGLPATGSGWLLDGLLRKTWGFKGFVVSDANAVKSLVTHGFAENARDSALRALKSGVDMEMAISDPAYDHLADALADEPSLAEVLDAAVRRVLTAKAEIGLLDAPFVDEAVAAEVLGCSEHRDAARVAAEKSMVLLRNEGRLLPLAVHKLRSLAVIGPLADSARDTLGPWVFDYDLDETVTILDGIRGYAGADVQVVFEPGIRVVQRKFPSMFDQFGGNRPQDPEDFDETAAFEAAVEAARAADVAVVVVGEWQNMIGEAASRSSLDLPGRQLELLQAVVATGTPVVALVMNGRPLDLRWPASHVPAILDVWYPGTKGGEAVARVLFGDVAPGGKLPFSWPRSVGQVPIVYSHRLSHEPENHDRRYWDEASTPLFPFGFGLTYGDVQYSLPVIDRDQMGLHDVATISVSVLNTVDRAVDDVVQLYLHQRFGSASRPVRELKLFQRVTLEARESRTLEFLVGPEERSYWSAASHSWVVEPSVFDVWIGPDSATQLGLTFQVLDS
jgi:beta-glucosidase